MISIIKKTAKYFFHSTGLPVPKFVHDINRSIIHKKNKHRAVQENFEDLQLRLASIESLLQRQESFSYMAQLSSKSNFSAEKIEKKTKRVKKKSS